MFKCSADALKSYWKKKTKKLAGRTDFQSPDDVHV